MSTIIVLDASIPISLYNAGHLQILGEIFKDPAEYVIYMSEDNFDECKRKGLSPICDELEKFGSFKLEKDIDKTKLKEIKEICEKKLKIKLHQDHKKDTDYQVMLVAIEKKANFMVTNDSALFNAFDKYRVYKRDNEIDRIQPLTLALFLQYLRKTNKNILSPIRAAKVNFDVYEKVEIPRSYEMIRYKSEECKIVQAIFRPYSENVLDIVTGI